MENIEKFNVSVILPIKSGKSNNFDELFKKSIESLNTQQVGINELIIVHTDESFLTEFLESFDFGGLNVKRFVWTEEPNYAKQVNYGVEKAESDWVSFYEFDDEYSSIWFKNVEKYSKVYTEIDAFLPIVVDINDKGVFAGFTNEATFAANFTKEIGYLDHEILLEYQNFQTSGMVIKRNSFLEVGGFKPSLKLIYGHELFLRLTHHSVKIMSIPRIGYKHLNLREEEDFDPYGHGDKPSEPFKSNHSPLILFSANILCNAFSSSEHPS